MQATECAGQQKAMVTEVARLMETCKVLWGTGEVPNEAEKSGKFSRKESMMCREGGAGVSSCGMTGGRGGWTVPGRRRACEWAWS